MKRNHIIIILLIIVIIMLSIGILFTSGILQHSYNMKTIALSETCTINVTESDTNITLYADTVKLYNDTENDIFIVSYNSQEALNSNGNVLGGAAFFAGMRDSLTIGENIGELNGFLLYKCNGYYSAKLVNNVTHDNIVIVCEDLDLLKTIVSSAKFNNNTVTVNNGTNSGNPTINNSNTNDTRPDGVTDEEWQAHLDYMAWLESNPYSAEDGSRFPTIEERDEYQDYLTYEYSETPSDSPPAG